MATRWGIICVGKIANDFATALQILPKEEHQIVAVGERSLEDAQNFAAKFGINKAYGSYIEVAKDPNVDIVYIAIIQSLHYDVAMEVLKAGKPVLCEKPLCVNVRQTKQLTQTAKECGLFLMEAMWSRFFPAYKELGRRLKDGDIGEVVQVIASFGVDKRHIDRLNKPETGGGATLEYGIYPVQLITLAMGGDKPIKVLAGGHLNDKGVDVISNACLVYSNGRAASMSASIKVTLPAEAFIVGTKGTIKVPYPMWAPEKIEGPWGESFHPLPKHPGAEWNFPYGQGLTYEMTEVRRCLKEGLLESPGMPHSETITLAEVMEQVRKQVGTVYPQDTN